MCLCRIIINKIYKISSFFCCWNNWMCCVSISIYCLRAWLPVLRHKIFCVMLNTFVSFFISFVVTMFFSVDYFYSPYIVVVEHVFLIPLLLLVAAAETASYLSLFISFSVLFNHFRFLCHLFSFIPYVYLLFLF